MLLIIVAVLVLVISIVLAWLVGPLLGLAGTSLLILRILLIAIGAGTAAFIFYLFFKEKRQDAAAKSLPGGTDLDTLLRDAEHRLATAQRTGPKSIDTLPLLYILGESNSAKTTAVLKSGFDPELLAGQVYRDQDIVATPVINLWFAHNCIFAEAGDAIRRAPALWHRLIRKSRPKATRSAIGKEAPVRAAVVCVSSELFLGPTATDASLAAARNTNQMLRDLAQQLGTEVPVYVIVTKLDRIPYFGEYVRNLNEEEVVQPLGTAFPRNAVSSGLYAERAMAEATSALDRLFFSLGEYRLEVLSRETDPANVDPDYEFPREMRKLRNNLAGYLVELTRPSHLNANPYLRGFYFTGVRAHMVEQMVAAAAQQARPEAAGSGATRMFSVDAMRAAAAAPTPQVVSRKQAQWCFLPHLFPGVILGDRSALAVTSNSARTHIVRRVAFASLCVVLLALLTCFTISWAKNSALERRISTAAAALPTTPVPATMLAATTDLKSLDQLRSALVQLENYQKNGAPLMYRWGLYHGDSLLAAARRIYFDRFRILMLSNTQADLVSYLSSLPAQPQAGADYSAAYDPLKAYLITTSNPDKSTVDFLTPVLTQYWLNGRAVDTDQKTVASNQFAFYAAELVRNNPYSIAPDTLTVTKARTYLAGFGGFERIYQQMLTAAGKTSPSVNFNLKYPGSSATVIDSHIVPGAFTATGFTFMQDAINHPDRYFSGEVWVLGDQAPPSLDRATLTTQLETRYTTDFTTQWRQFLQAASVVRYTSLANAATKLQLISNPNSPLLALLYEASHNTAVANADLSKEFQPTQHVVAPASLDILIGPGNQSYMNGLLGLQAAVAQVAQSPNPGDPNAVAPIIAASASAHTAASQTAQAFTIDPAAHVDQTVLALLQAPINDVDDVVRGQGPAQANAGAAGFCSAFTPLMAKFPFSPNSSIEASPSEVAAVLQPGSGSLWQFYDKTVKNLLVRAGSQYVPVPNPPMKINPSYIPFFNRVAALSNALYPPPGAPGLTFTTQILPSKGINSVTVGIDSQNLTGSNVSKQFTWSLATSQQSQLIANYGTGTLPLLQFSGPWAVFHLMDKGRTEAGNPGRLAYPLEISNTPIVVNGTPLVVYLQLSGQDANLLMPGGLGGMRCVPTIAH